MSHKETKWFKPFFNENDYDPPVEPPKKKPKSNNKNTSEKNLKFVGTKSCSDELTTPGNVNTYNWIKSFTPQTVADLAVHHKKIEEIVNWLQMYETTKHNPIPKSIILLTGPSGAGKTTTINVLAKEYKYTVQEWITPVDIDLIRTRTSGFNNEETYKENQIDRFEEFLFKSSRYTSLFDSNENKLVLIEDFPNIFFKKPDEFAGILERYAEYGKAPLVFIVTDTKSKKADISFNLFGDAIREKYQITKISFNPSSTTLLKKALNRICLIMSKPPLSDIYKLPTHDQINSIILTSQGDIRNAMINLHFGSHKNSISLPTQIVNVPKTNKKSTKLKTIGCDHTITFMHTLGRIFNPKYVETPSNEPQRLLYSPEQISDDFSSQPSTFTNMIHSNYLCHYKTIEDCKNAADILSTSDIYSSEWQDDHLIRLSLNMIVRGVMVLNQSPAQGWIPVKGTVRPSIENKIVQYSDGCYITQRVLQSEIRTYSNIIKGQS